MKGKEVIEILQDLEDKKGSLLNLLEVVKRTFGVDKLIIDHSKMKIEAAVNVVREGGKSNGLRLPEREQKRILDTIIGGVVRKGRPLFVLLPREDGKGLFDPQSGKQFMYE